MKRLLLAISLFSSPAFAQQNPSFDELRAQYLMETGELRHALGQREFQLIQIRKENADLKAKGEQKPEVKK